MSKSQKKRKRRYFVYEVKEYPHEVLIREQDENIGKIR